MIYDCSGCGAALTFDPDSGKMKCSSCGKLYESYELEHFNREEEASALSGNRETGMPDRKISYPQGRGGSVRENAESFDEQMECYVYICTACGAEIYVNDVEVSTFCAYCGQPNVIFDRAGSARRPQYVIPFSVSQDQAVSLIRKRLSKGFFIPKEIRDFEIERVRGIYIPFWLYDIHCYDREYLKGVVGSGKYKRTYHYYREAEGDFRRITVDASIRLADESSQRLEPYDVSGLKEFRMEYLSGFYADNCDAMASLLNDDALYRAKRMFEAEIAKTVKAQDIQIIKQDPKHEIQKTEYAMFPAWFLTFRYQELPYTVLVNGQTGKLVAGLPYDKKKMHACTGILGSLFSVGGIAFSYAMMQSEGGWELVKAIIALFVLGAFALTIGLPIMDGVKTSTELTSLAQTNNYVKDRQGGD